ncbi:FecR family protein [Rhizobium sp. RM]|uniref:FecR family protein n=1 Tax=Rhizobium sp. RM TaxID=2748079 RepID=UPI00110D36F8|nr:FecR family protein [Rhizobium sp. RM]TMV17566.1 FecR family protein [Rhizobium sp. Td3]
MAATNKDKQRKARDEALTWFVRINSGDATEGERSDHKVWLASDPMNCAEYVKLGGIWSDLDRIADPRKVASRQTTDRPLSSRRAFLVGGASALAAATVALVVGPPDFLASDHFTGTGEFRSVVLADGTKVELDAHTAIALNYSDTTRTVHLLRGRAFFDVAKDADRPFEVMAAGGSTTALGTRFVVHEWSGAVTVSVEESAVSVLGPDSSNAVLNAGQYVTYDDNRLGNVQPVDVESELAWRRGKLIFEDRPLRQVLADVNRYRSGTIQVTDSRLLNMRVSGIFDISNPDGVLDAIRTTLPVRTFPLSSWLVVLHPA